MSPICSASAAARPSRVASASVPTSSSSFMVISPLG
jgi:hypothetical protein